MNTSLNDSANEIHCDMEVEQLSVKKIVLTRFYPLVSIPIMILNMLVVISSGLILKKKQEPRTTYLFLGNLAMADGIFGMILIFIDLFRALDDSQQILCMVQNVLKMSCVLASPFSVGLIAVDRYFYILYGMQYSRWLYPTRARFLIGCTWIISIIIGVLPLSSYSKRAHGEQCLLIDLPNIFVIIFAVAGMAPLPVILILYSIILYRALQKIKQLKIAAKNKATTNNNPTENMRISIIGGSQSKLPDLDVTNNIQKKITQIFARKTSHSLRAPKKWKAVKIVLFTTGALTITWLPFCLAYFIYACFGCHKFSTDSWCINFKQIILTEVAFCGFLNSLLNPIIYAWWHKGFRQFVKRKIKQLRRQSISQNTSITSHPTSNSQTHITGAS